VKELGKYLSMSKLTCVDFDFRKHQNQMSLEFMVVLKVEHN